MGPIDLGKDDSLVEREPCALSLEVVARGNGAHQSREDESGEKITHSNQCPKSLWPVSFHSGRYRIFFRTPRNTRPGANTHEFSSQEYHYSKFQQRNPPTKMIDEILREQVP